MQTAQSHKDLVRDLTNVSDRGLESSILKVLAYFDIFQYPLTISEIKLFLDQPVIGIALEKTLKKLVSEKLAFIVGDFYSLRNDPGLADNRLKGNERAAILLEKAKRIGKFLQSFPFVRGIGISGSLSKNYADRSADIDFFIITETNRLWIARSFMHIFKKFTYLAGRQHYYCMNYYVDESELQVRDQNIYTAIEIKTLLPVCAPDKFANFFTKNEWANDYLPVCSPRITGQSPAPGFLKKLVEKCLRGKRGDIFDDYLMRFTEKRWKRKEARGLRNKKGLTMGLITGKHFARSNPEHFQEKLLAVYHTKVNALMDRLIISSEG